MKINWNGAVTMIPAAVLALVFLICGIPCVAAGEVLLGSPDFQPTPERPMGWRGDGSGKYPAAKPPLKWSRVSGAVKELRSRAAKPKEGEMGKPIPDGVVREWLTLGPVPIPEGKKATDEFSGDEAGYFPGEGDKVGDLEWKKTTLDTSWLNFQEIYGKGVKDHKTVAAYAYASIYSPGGRQMALDFMLSGGARLWLNGKLVGTYGANGNRAVLKMEKGWNRLLLRVSPITETNWSRGVVQWYLNTAFFGIDPADYESSGILWTTPLPDNGPGVGSPIVVGDRIFLQSENCDLVCFNKADGKVLWAKSSTYADAATAEEKSSQPEVFKEIAQHQAKLQELLTNYCAAPDKFKIESKGLKASLGGTINGLMKKVDPKKYGGQSGSEAGQSAPTPVSDGKRVYAIFGSGVVACYDLQGERKWVTFVNVKNIEHGYCISPCLADGKLLVPSSQNFGLAALDCKTGAELWRTPQFKNGLHNMASSPVIFTIGGKKLVALSFGSVARVEDGKVLNEELRPPYPNVSDMTSPVFDNNVLCSQQYKGDMAFAFQTMLDKISEPLKMADVKTCVFDTKKFPTFFNYDLCASPLLHQGLAYVLSIDGVLTVIDAAKGEVVYQKMLDLSPVMAHGGILSGPLRGGCGASPTLAGKYIYIWDNQGSTVVIEPGRDFKQVARNRIEQLWYQYGAPQRNECTISNPVFEGKRLYRRGDVNLYCLGEPGQP